MNGSTPRPLIRTPAQLDWQPDDNGRSRADLTDPGLTSGGFDARMVRIPAGQETDLQAWHAHGHEQGFWVLKGELGMRIGDREPVVPPGGYLNVGAGVPHQPFRASSHPLELLIVSAPADGANHEPPAAGGDTAGSDRFTLRLPGEGETITAVGDCYRFLVTGNDTGGRYAIWHATVPPGGGPPPHRHSREDEFFYLLEGRMSFFDDGQRHLAGPGAAVTLPRHGRHWFKNEGDQPAAMLIAAAPAGLDQMLIRAGREWCLADGPPPPPTEGDIGRLMALVSDYGIEIG